ncbi:hypothetical protein PSPO01_10844 [Paraphaeosphaeria sporulosa]
MPTTPDLNPTNILQTTRVVLLAIFILALLFFYCKTTRKRAHAAIGPGGRRSKRGKWHRRGVSALSTITERSVEGMRSGRQTPRGSDASVGG